MFVSVCEPKGTRSEGTAAHMLILLGARIGALLEERATCIPACQSWVLVRQWYLRAQLKWKGGL